MSDRLGTAQWEEQSLVAQRHPFAQGKFWLGRADDATAIGYRDDRHICLVSGTRGGKGASVIINNLCFWPGSAVVVDPKGENATVTAARRGQGSEHCTGMGQAVHVLDPFKTAHVDERYLSSFNPLDALDPQREETIDEASRLANAIIVVKEDSKDPMWDEAARTMVRGLILHVLTAKEFTDDERNLVTVRTLISRGEWRVAEAIRELGHDEDKIDPAHLLLWKAMEMNPAFNGVVAGTGSRFRSMMVSTGKTFEGVLQSTAQHTEFLDSPGMRRVLAKSDFKLSELKTRPEGMTLYLSLPQRYMETHYRWLRMMVSLTTTEMEITRGQPASGYPVLMILDEFAGLRRMTAIENAVSQIAGFGVKLLFVLQSLEQLKNTYKDNWETFLSNAGLKVFFSVEDHFSREYVSKLVGETEIIREMHSANESKSQNESHSEGRSRSQTVSKSTTAGVSGSETTGSNEGTGWSRGTSGGVSYEYLRSLPFFSLKPRNFHFSEGRNSSVSGSSGTSRSDTRGTSTSKTDGTSHTTGDSQTYTRGSSTTTGSGSSESLHRRPLIQPDEVGRFFGRVDEKEHPAYPGLALVIVTGANPFVVKRRNYFEDEQFINCFSPHPDHKFVPVAPKVVEAPAPEEDAKPKPKASDNRALYLIVGLIILGVVALVGSSLDTTPMVSLGFAAFVLFGLLTLGIIATRMHRKMKRGDNATPPASVPP
jgi:type IV secretory pathway TraG/TraD family ATPase VirD4